MGCNGCCLRRDRLGFRLSVSQWKEAFAHPGGCFSRPCAGSYAAVRLTIFLLWLACVVWSFAWQVDRDGPSGVGKWCNKLTHWSAVIELVYFGLAAYATYRARAAVAKGHAAADDTTAAPWFASAAWCLGEVVPSACALVFLLFWALDFPLREDKTLDALTVTMHGGNYILCLADFVSSRLPNYVEHVYAPMVYALTYLTFTLVYYAAGGRGDNGTDPYIYAALDWSKPASTSVLALGVLLVGVPLVYMLHYAISRCRSACQAREPTNVAAQAEAGQPVPADIVGQADA